MSDPPVTLYLITICHLFGDLHTQIQTLAYINKDIGNARQIRKTNPRLSEILSNPKQEPTITIKTKKPVSNKGSKKSVHCVCQCGDYCVFFSLCEVYCLSWCALRTVAIYPFLLTQRVRLMLCPCIASLRTQ